MCVGLVGWNAGRLAEWRAEERYQKLNSHTHLQTGQLGQWLEVGLRRSNVAQHLQHATGGTVKGKQVHWEQNKWGEHAGPNSPAKRTPDALQPHQMGDALQVAHCFQQLFGLVRPVAGVNHKRVERRQARQGRHAAVVAVDQRQPAQRAQAQQGRVIVGAAGMHLLKRQGLQPREAGQLQTKARQGTGQGERANARRRWSG